MPECPECIHRPECPSLAPLGGSHGASPSPLLGPSTPISAHLGAASPCPSCEARVCVSSPVSGPVYFSSRLDPQEGRTLGWVHCLPFLGLRMDPAANPGSAHCAQPLWDGTPWARAQPVRGSPSLTSVPEGAASPSLLPNGSSFSVSSNRLKHRSSLLTVNTRRLHKQGLVFSFRTSTQTEYFHLK